MQEMQKIKGKIETKEHPDSKSKEHQLQLNKDVTLKRESAEDGRGIEKWFRQLFTTLSHFKSSS